MLTSEMFCLRLLIATHFGFPLATWRVEMKRFIGLSVMAWFPQATARR